jgi:membrane protein required for colicin V production
MYVPIVEAANMYLSQWTWLDFLCIGIILTSMAFAILKGFMREIISLIALIAGFVLAVLYYSALGRQLAPLCRTDAVADLIGFMIIFLGFILIGAITAFLVNRLIKSSSMEWIDRLLGALFGLIRGWIIASILVLALVAFPINENLLARSFLAPYFIFGARAAVLVVPQDMKSKFYEQYKKVLQAWNKKGGAK